MRLCYSCHGWETSFKNKWEKLFFSKKSKKKKRRWLFRFAISGQELLVRAKLFYRLKGRTRDIHRNLLTLPGTEHLVINFMLHKEQVPPVGRWRDRCTGRKVWGFTRTSQLVWETCWIQWASGGWVPHRLQYSFSPAGATKPYTLGL